MIIEYLINQNHHSFFLNFFFFFGSETKEKKNTQSWVREGWLQNNLIAEVASHVLPRCPVPNVCSVRLIMEHMHLELGAKGASISSWSAVAVAVFKIMKHWS